MRPFRRWRRGHRYKDASRPLRARERQIATAYAVYLIAAWDLLKATPRAQQRAVQTLIMIRAMEHATYVNGGNRYYHPRIGFVKKNGEISVQADKRAKYFLDMPRMQRAVDETLNAHNFTLDKCAEIMAEIATDKAQSASDRLRAIDMRIRLTTGYAPTKSGVLHAHTNVDAFFDEKDFENAPPVTIEAQP